MWRDENLPSRFRELGPRARLLQLATGASRLISKTLGEKALKLVRRAKCLSGCCGVPEADMTCLILGGGQRGADVSLPVVEVLLPAPALVLVGVALCAWARRLTRTNHSHTVNSSSGAHPVGKPNTPTEIRSPAEWGGGSDLIQGGKVRYVSARNARNVTLMLLYSM